MKTLLEKPVSEKSIFDMTEAELQERIKPTADKARQAAFDKNTYLTYVDEELCPEGTMIREYKDRKELVRFGEQGEAIIVRNL